VYRRYVPPQLSHATEAYAHNLFLNIWTELGLVGLLLFLPILIKALRSAYRLSTTGDPFFRAMFAALAGVLVHQMVDVPIYGAQIGGAFWGLVGHITLAESDSPPFPPDSTGAADSGYQRVSSTESAAGDTDQEAQRW
jgi:hypothetical protein